MPANTRTIGYSMILTQKCIVQFTDMKKPDTVANKFGIKTEKYYQSCSLVRKQPDMKRMVMRYTYAIILLTICGVLSIVSSMYFMPCGILGFLF